MEVLKIQNLSKSYGKLKALDDLNLVIESGQIMGLLGPNGSGKTTTLGIILGILSADSGNYTWFENKYDGKHRLRIGSILETPNFFPYLNADQNLDIVRQIKKVPKQEFDDLLELVQLKSRRKSNFRTFSLGMKQRLAIAATLIGDPDVVIFDEPTNGLDPQGIMEVRSTLSRIATRGKTVFMASHILDEVEKICTHVTIIKRGKLLATGPVGSILSKDLTIEVASQNNELLIGFLRSREDVKNILQKNGIVECQVDQKLDVSEFSKSIFNIGIVPTHFVARKKRLEEEFLEITK